MLVLRYTRDIYIEEFKANSRFIQVVLSFNVLHIYVETASKE